MEGLKQCCEAGMIYSGSGYDFLGVPGSRKKFQIQPDPIPIILNKLEKLRENTYQYRYLISYCISHQKEESLNCYYF